MFKRVLHKNASNHILLKKVFKYFNNKIKHISYTAIFIFKKIKWL